MNTRKIQPIQTWSPESGNIELDTLCLKDFFHYFFNGEGGMVSYSLINSSNNNEYFQNNIEIPASVIQNWGASDDIIWNYVASELGFVFVNP